MRHRHHIAVVAIILLVVQPISYASEALFTGSWSIDLRTPIEQKNRAECGEARFFLKQVESKITGDHTMSTVGCGRLNEGGEGTVTGAVKGKIAFLVVTSGRNGAVVKGKATLEGNSLRWRTTEEVKAGEPEGDSPLILGSGLLTKDKEVRASANF